MLVRATFGSTLTTPSPTTVIVRGPTDAASCASAVGVRSQFPPPQTPVTANAAANAMARKRRIRTPGIFKCPFVMQAVFNTMLLLPTMNDGTTVRVPTLLSK
jgi:hypothetical protein